MPTSPASSAADAGAVRSVLVAVRVLEGLAEAGRPMGVSDLARAIGEQKGRVHRHLGTLRQAGLVEQEAASDRYRLSWRLFRLGQAAAEQFDLRQLAEPLMQRLRDATGQTVLLAVPQAGEVLVVHALESADKVCITVRPGNRPPLHCSAQGRITLAFAAPETLDRVLAGPLPAATPHSMTDPVALRARLALLRARLWESAESEVLLGINMLAAPILAGVEPRLVGSIGLIGSVQHLPEPPPTAVLAQLRGAAAALSRRLGSDAYGETA
jgi:DNA-binding IclR family transcriptional regulator